MIENQVESETLYFKYYLWRKVWMNLNKLNLTTHLIFLLI